MIGSFWEGLLLKLGGRKWSGAPSLGMRILEACTLEKRG
jgi:hypothetical protein